MDYSSASAYVFAKAGGMLGKSFTGPRAAKLFTVKSLAELWTLIFKTDVPLVPETLLARQIEAEAGSRFVNQYVHLIEMYTHPDEILVEQLRFFDIENLKEIGAALCAQEQKMPAVIDIGKYSMFHSNKWPDIAKITEGSPYAWYNRIPDIHEQQKFDMRLDTEYVQRIWTAANRVTGEAKEPVVEMFRREFIMKNIIWAIRLKVYYDMSVEEIKTHLAYVDEKPGKSDPVYGPALDAAEKAVDSYEDWSSWKYASFLNPHEEGNVWKIDPRWVESSFRVDDSRRAEKLFHAFPLTVAVPVAWFKIKQHELDCIRTATESIRLSADSSEAMKAAGITAAVN